MHHHPPNQERAFNLPVRSPSFRASASVTVQWPAFASGVPPDIYAFHRYTWSSSHPSRTQAWQYQGQFRS